MSSVRTIIMTRWRAHTAMTISQWGDFGPLAGSATVLKIGKLLGSLAKPNVFEAVFATIPVLFVVHSSIADEKRVGSLRKVSKLSVPFTLKILGKRTWSIKLAPTAGLSMRIGMSSASRSSAFPIPDNWSICVVPIVPADRITSLRAFTVVNAETPRECYLMFSRAVVAYQVNC